MELCHFINLLSNRCRTATGSTISKWPLWCEVGRDMQDKQNVFCCQEDFCNIKVPMLQSIDPTKDETEEDSSRFNGLFLDWDLKE